MTAKIRVTLSMVFDLDPEDYEGIDTYKEMYLKEVENIRNNPENIIDSMAEEGDLTFEFLPDETEY